MPDAVGGRCFRVSEQVFSAHAVCPCCRCSILNITNSTITCAMPSAEEGTVYPRAALYDRSLNSAGEPRGIVSRAYFASFRYRAAQSPDLTAASPTELPPVSGGGSRDIALTWQVQQYDGAPTAEHVAAARALFMAGNETVATAEVRSLST